MDFLTRPPVARRAAAAFPRFEPLAARGRSRTARSLPTRPARRGDDRSTVIARTIGMTVVVSSQTGGNGARSKAGNGNHLVVSYIHYRRPAPPDEMTVSLCTGVERPFDRSSQVAVFTGVV